MPPNSDNFCMISTFNEECPDTCTYAHRPLIEDEVKHVLEKSEVVLAKLEKELK